MIDKSHISYNQLLEIISWGVFSMKMKGKSVSDKKLSDYNRIEGAMYGGIYTGSPGRDIYFMLPYLSDTQMAEAALKLADKFLTKPPDNYVNVAALVRFIYGQFEKQGILRSEKDFERMKKEKLEWFLSRKFLGLLKKELKNRNNNYGLSMIYEMEGHRLGDEAVISYDKNKLKKMEDNYLKCVRCAIKCKGHKHMFSIYYWAYKYFKEFGDIENAVKYGKLSIKNSKKYYYKYFPNGENYYSSRLKKTFSYIEQNDVRNKDNFTNKYKKYINNELR